MFCVIIAINLNEDFVFLKFLLIAFSLFYSFMIPAYFVITTVKSLFYKTFTGMIIVIMVYIIIHLTKWVLQKFEFIGK